MTARSHSPAPSLVLLGVALLVVFQLVAFALVDGDSGDESASSSPSAAGSPAERSDTDRSKPGNGDDARGTPGDVTESPCRSDAVNDAAHDSEPSVLRPFAADSPWNSLIPDDAVYHHDDPRTEQLRTETVAHPDEGGEWPVRTWVNVERYSIPVVVAGPSDPEVGVAERGTDEVHQVRVPDGAEPAEGRDGHLVVVRPDLDQVTEMWQAAEQGDGQWTAGRLETTTLSGWGVGPEGGVRAYGGSALGGLIRTWEVDPAHPAYTDGVIRHALAMALPSQLLRYDGGPGGYDDEGYGTAKGYVFPATEQDFDSPYTYRGAIPMGTRVALPPDLDLETLDIGPESCAVAWALQRYGAYVTDRSSSDTVAFYAEPDVPEEWASKVRGPSLTGGELALIRDHLVVVEADAERATSGGGDR